MESVWELNPTHPDLTQPNNKGYATSSYYFLYENEFPKSSRLHPTQPNPTQPNPTRKDILCLHITFYMKMNFLNHIDSIPPNPNSRIVLYCHIYVKY